MDVVVVVPGSVEEALTMEEVMHRLLVLQLVVLVSVIGWTPGVAVHEEHEGPLHGADCLHHEGHGGSELLSNFLTHLLQQRTGVRRGDTLGTGWWRLCGRNGR